MRLVSQCQQLMGRGRYCDDSVCMVVWDKYPWVPSTLERRRDHLCCIASSVYQFKPSSAIDQPPPCSTQATYKALWECCAGIQEQQARGQWRKCENANVENSEICSHILGRLRSGIQRQWGSCTIVQWNIWCSVHVRRSCSRMTRHPLDRMQRPRPAYQYGNDKGEVEKGKYLPPDGFSWFWRLFGLLCRTFLEETLREHRHLDNYRWARVSDKEVRLRRGSSFFCDKTTDTPVSPNIPSWLFLPDIFSQHSLVRSIFPFPNFLISRKRWFRWFVITE